MTAVYVVSVLVGFLLAVRSMFTGVEKTAARDAAPPRVRLGIPTIAAFATGFGLTGYLLERADAPASPGLRLGLALIVGCALVAVTLVLLAAWARPALARSDEDPRYALQGLPARVTRPITPPDAGEVEFEVDGRVQRAPALGFEGGAHAPGEDVVIDRIEDGVAYVEAWSLVEQRL